ncbi:MAG TPA: Ig-like domain-containing protein [Pseudomonadota bacterium]|nr:Ig-like domain-containing protein [Pseudomonadota bacterium]
MTRMNILFGSLRNSFFARALGLLSCAVVPAACGDSAAPDSTQSVPTLDQLSLSLPASLALGRSATAKAMATYSDGSQIDVSDRVTWSSDSQAILTVSDGTADKGALRAVGIGVAYVQVSLDGKSASAQLAVGAAELDVLSPLPSAKAVAKGLSIALAAQGTYSDGSVSDVGSSVVWSVSDSSIASIGVNDRGAAQLTGLQEGQVTLHAQLGDKGTDVQIQVTAAVLTSVAMGNTTPLLSAGNTLQLMANGAFSDGSSQDVTSQGDWTSSDESIASVGNGDGSKGLVTALKGGAVTISVMVAGQIVSYDLTVY